MEFKSKEQQKQDLSQYQRKKLIIDDVYIEGSVKAYEYALQQFLSKYGTVVDLIIMDNCMLNR